MLRLIKLLLLTTLATVLFVLLFFPLKFFLQFVLEIDNQILRAAVAGAIVPFAGSVAIPPFVYFSGKGATWGRHKWSANFDIQLEWEDALSLCRDSLSVLTRPYSVQPIYKGDTEIFARAPWHWKHGGEQEVYFEFWNLGNSLVRVELSVTGGECKRETEALIDFVKTRAGSARIMRCTPVYSVI